MGQQCPLQAKHVPAEDLVTAAHSAQPLSVLNAVPGRHNITRLHWDGAFTWYKTPIFIKTTTTKTENTEHSHLFTHHSQLWFVVCPVWNSQRAADGPLLHHLLHCRICQTELRHHTVPCCNKTRYEKHRFNVRRTNPQLKHAGLGLMKG